MWSMGRPLKYILNFHIVIMYLSGLYYISDAQVIATVEFFLS